MKSTAALPARMTRSSTATAAKTRPAIRQHILVVSSSFRYKAHHERHQGTHSESATEGMLGCNCNSLMTGKGRVILNDQR